MRHAASLFALLGYHGSDLNFKESDIVYDIVCLCIGLDGCAGG